MKENIELVAERWGDTGGDVYFIQSNSIGNPIKIGRSLYPEERIKQLQQSTSHELCLLATIPNGGKETERKLHSRFRRSKIKGEWFKPSQSLIKLINEIRQGDFSFVENNNITHINPKDEEYIERMAEKALINYRRAIKRDIKNGMRWHEIRKKYHITANYYTELMGKTNANKDQPELESIKPKTIEGEKERIRCLLCKRYPELTSLFNTIAKEVSAKYNPDRMGIKNDIRRGLPYYKIITKWHINMNEYKKLKRSAMDEEIAG